MKTGILSNFKGDLLGGITAGVIALPLAIAFGVSSGLGAAAGIYGSIIVGMLASIFGGTPTQITGPTGPLTVVIASVIAMHSDNPNLIFAAIFLSGLFQIVLGIFKVGKLVNFIPYPVISGFMSGIGAIIILLQINPFLGLEFSGTPVEGLLFALSAIDVYVRDVEYLVNFLLSLLFYATPIVYTADMFGQYKWILYLNPMTHFIDAYRSIFYYQTSPSLISLGYIALFAAIFLFFGYMIFRKLEKGFAEEV